MPSIAGLQKFTLQDFPGTPAAILFTRGCNLRCPYCHNAELLGPGENLPEAEVWEFLEARRERLAGVVITGGEPTLHAALPSFLTTLRGMGYRIKLDSNGMRPDVISSLLTTGLVDHLSLDWKLPGDRYRELGGPVEAAGCLQACAASARAAGVTLEWRTTVAEPLLAAADIRCIGAQLQAGDRWSIQQYRPCTGPFDSPQSAQPLRPFDPQVLEQLVTEFSGLRITLR